MNNFLLFLNISGGEILLILIVVYLVFGPKKIPELARMLGKGINEMRRATNEIKNEINREVSGVKKNLNVDIDMNDPLDIKKTVEGTMNSKKSNQDGPVKQQEKVKAEPKGEVDAKKKGKGTNPPGKNAEAKKKKQKKKSTDKKNTNL